MNGLMNSENIANKMKSKIRTDQFADFYTLEEEIGRGKFAVVKRCRHRENGKEFAAKFLKKRRRGKDCREVILHEIVMLETALLHPRLIDLVDVYETRHEIVLVTEYAAGGELFQQCVVEESFKERDVIRLMRQILEGLVFLHDRNIVHLDLKPQNILLTKVHPEGEIKLCDFGFARLVNSDEDIRDIIGTPDYVAPEILNYEPIRTASDMWGVGVLAYVMLTGCSPYAGDNKQETFCNISQNLLDFPDDLFTDISTEACNFMKSVLLLEPQERLTARECLCHPWLRVDEASLHPVKSITPIGSPLGHRRAHSPPNKETSTMGPTKKYKIDNKSDTQLDNDNDNNTKSVDENLNNTSKDVCDNVRTEALCNGIDKSDDNTCTNSPTSSSPSVTDIVIKSTLASSISTTVTPIVIVNTIDSIDITSDIADNDDDTKENLDLNIQNCNSFELRPCSVTSVDSCISMKSVGSIEGTVTETHGVCISTTTTMSVDDILPPNIE